MSPTQTTDGGEVDPSEAIGVYYLAGEELTKDPADRTYVQDALWTPEGWVETSNGETVEDAPEERTLEAFEEFWGDSRHFFVYRPDEVPGEIEESEPVVSAGDIGLEDELR